MKGHILSFNICVYTVQFEFYNPQNNYPECSCLLIRIYTFIVVKIKMHILSFHRRSVLNVLEDFTVLDQRTPTLGKCLELVLPPCVLKDTIALQVGYNSAAMLTQTCNVFRSCYQIQYKYVSVKSDAAASD